ncbi:hypothetical protein O5560_27590, partial [Escherichia coli]|nr:hypothetical protein [Escherichia coli]
MGLVTVNESDFKTSLATFAQERDKLASEYQKLRNENQKRYRAERDERIKREKEESKASEKTIAKTFGWYYLLAATLYIV